MATLTRTLTYAQLVAEITAGTLNKGEGITISDFTTIHNFLDGDTTLAVAPNVATVEPLTVYATSNSTIDCVAKSSLYPYDVIYYDWNPDNWLNDRAFSDVDSAGFGAGTIITGFKGVITYREDTIQKNSTYYDFRGVKFRRWALNPLIWSNSETYAKNGWVKDGNDIYKSVADSNTNHAVSDEAWWIKVIDTNKTVYWSWSSLDMNGCPVDSEDFIDCPTWVSYIEAANNKIGLKHNANDDPMISTILANIVFVEAGDLMGTYNVFDNKFEGGSYFGNSSIGAYFSGNSIAQYFFGNSIAQSFSKNSIAQYFRGNSIAQGFSENSIAQYFSGNSIAQDFYGNSIAQYFFVNSIAQSFSRNSVFGKIENRNLTTITELYDKQYNHELIACDGGGVLIRWYNSSGVLQTQFVA